MQTDSLIDTLTGMINGLLADPKHFLVEVRIKPTNNIKVFIDSDEGIPLDEPLKLHRQYKKNMGRYVEITMNDATKKEGKLLETTEDGIIVETESGKGKKKEIKQETVLFNDIKSTKIQIKF
jgi:ribosome maturation factor RimP